MTPQLIAQLLAIAAMLIVAFTGISFLIVRREFNRWVEIVNRIPDTSWFEEVGEALKSVGPLHDAMIAAQRRISDLDEAWRADHDALLRLTAEHNLLHPFARKPHPLPPVEAF